ncbi:MAG: FHA domain-containing protein, partial [Anaerolineae bacterium]|nr:FHA domain-containing protein [Anaerolineae bacterium]
MRPRSGNWLSGIVLVGFAVVAAWEIPLCLAAVPVACHEELLSTVAAPRLSSSFVLGYAAPQDQPTPDPESSTSVSGTVEVGPPPPLVADPIGEAGEPSETSLPAEGETPLPVPGTTGGDTQGAGGFPRDLALFLGVALLALLVLGGAVVYLFRARKKHSADPKHVAGPRFALPRTAQSRTRLLLSEVPYLTFSGQGDALLRFALKPEGMTIGRAQDNDLVITEVFAGWDTISRHHARIYKQAAYWVVEDLNSHNGLYVNGRRTGYNV